MPRVYEGILRDDHIDWTTERPFHGTPVRVLVTVIADETEKDGRGTRMASALSELAERGGLGSIGDPQAWQRAVRRERDLPGREG